MPVQAQLRLGAHHAVGHVATSIGIRANAIRSDVHDGTKAGCVVDIAMRTSRIPAPGPQHPVRTHMDAVTGQAATSDGMPANIDLRCSAMPLRNAAA